MTRLAKILIKFYQNLISPLLGPRCRFYPTCSDYSMQCFEKFPFYIAIWYSLFRILRCHPFSEGGLDPIPANECNCH